MKTLPKYYYVKQDLNNPLWEKFINWLNAKTNMIWGGKTFLYYGYDGNHFYNETNGWDTPTMFENDAVEISLEDWDEAINDYTLPEKWCIKLTTQEAVDYCNKYGRIPPYYISNYAYAHFPSPDDFATIFSDIQPGYIELTNEQFKKYVLKQNEMKKEIIDYKLIKPEYNSAVMEIIGHDSKDSIIGSITARESINRLKRAGVLDLWFEPIYKESAPDITINNHKAEFFDDYVKFGCVEIHKRVFINLATISDYPHTNREIESVTIGKGTFSKAEIKSIANHYLNK